jgi:LAO/AO transport system kinase
MSGRWVTTAELVEPVLAGNRRAAARLISRIEAADPEVGPVVHRLYSAGADTPVLGITGPPGAGKSTLADQLITRWRQRGETVAVLAVDPSSPVSGGAILGDRVRMHRHSTDSGVFIRSMSARGHLGGLSSATGDALIVLDAMGFDRILIETVGTGQNEIDVLNHAHTVIVVQTPAGGDAVQAMKSGLLEIADVFVVNKMDTSGADRMAALLRETVEARPLAPGDWQPPVLKTQAAANTYIDELDASVQAHGRHLRTHPLQGAARQRTRMRALLLARLSELLRERYSRDTDRASAFEQRVDDILARRSDPASAALELLNHRRDEPL